jgi:galactokinase
LLERIPTSKIVAIDLNQEFEIDLLKDIELSSTNYFRVLKQLQDNGFDFSGVNCVFSSNIPVGSDCRLRLHWNVWFLIWFKRTFDLKN